MSTQIPTNTTDIIDSGDPTRGWAIVAGLFTLIALFLSIWEITHHAIHYNKPYLQKYVVRILWMVPIYATNAVGSLIVKIYTRKIISLLSF